ncbi:unnamed protein product [Linum trigynum]|uniref:Cytochrome P450 n=1 Tax=Linum trigynum TaxID=586398 RepID=A0AAV2DDF8_9ROSI
MEMINNITPIHLSLALAVLSVFLYCWFGTRTGKSVKGKLPPGSMGLPIIGETLQFFVPYTSNDVSPFIDERIKMYGPVFRSKLINRPIIVSTDAEVNQFVLRQEGVSFKPSYTKSFNDIVGDDSFFLLEGSAHRQVKNMVVEKFGHNGMRSLMYDFETHVGRHLVSWSAQPSVELKQAAFTMFFSFAFEKMFSLSDAKLVEEFQGCYDDFVFGLFSAPFYIPGTCYWKCLRGRKRAVNTIKRIMEERRSQVSSDSHKEGRTSDYLDFVLEEMRKDGTTVTEKVAVDLLFGLPFAASENASSTVVCAVQYLTNNPTALQELTREHEAIRKGREESDESCGISWKEYKSMTFTQMVINETIRLTNVVPVLFRKALKDVEVKGYWIPAGWTVVVVPTAVHMNPKVYDDPLSFNPWRWQGQQLNSVSQNFIAFGGGSRLCPGADFFRLQMAIILHHLVTNYRWDVIKGKEPVRYPALAFPDGFHVNILEKNEQLGSNK